MGDVYRAPAPLPPPACQWCLSSMVFDGMWAHWTCNVCGRCSCKTVGTQTLVNKTITAPPAAAQHKGDTR